MTLKEQIRPHAELWDCYNDEPVKYDHTNKLVKIAEEFAIGFNDWVNVNAYKYPTKITTKELLEIYKKEKGL